MQQVLSKINADFMFIMMDYTTEASIKSVSFDLNTEWKPVAVWNRRKTASKIQNSTTYIWKWSANISSMSIRNLINSLSFCDIMSFWFCSCTLALKWKDCCDVGTLWALWGLISGFLHPYWLTGLCGDVAMSLSCCTVQKCHKKEYYSCLYSSPLVLFCSTVLSEENFWLNNWM